MLLFFFYFFFSFFRLLLSFVRSSPLFFRSSVSSFLSFSLSLARVLQTLFSLFISVLATELNLQMSEHLFFFFPPFPQGFSPNEKYWSFAQYTNDHALRDCILNYLSKTGEEKEIVTYFCKLQEAYNCASFERVKENLLPLR